MSIGYHKNKNFYKKETFVNKESMSNSNAYTDEMEIEDIKDENEWLQEQQEKAEAAGDETTAKKAAKYILGNEKRLKKLMGMPEENPGDNNDTGQNNDMTGDQILNAVSADNEPMAQKEEPLVVYADGTIGRRDTDLNSAINEKFKH